MKAMSNHIHVMDCIPSYLNRIGNHDDFEHVHAHALSNHDIEHVHFVHLWFETDQHTYMIV